VLLTSPKALAIVGVEAGSPISENCRAPGSAVEPSNRQYSLNGRNIGVYLQPFHAVADVNQLLVDVDFRNEYLRVEFELLYNAIFAKSIFPLRLLFTIRHLVVFLFYLQEGKRRAEEGQQLAVEQVQLEHRT